MTIMAIGSALLLFHQMVNGPPRILPLKERKEIVARDRAFLEQLEPLEPSRQPNELAQQLEPRRQPTEPGIAAVVGDKCSGKDCRVVSLTTQAVAVANLPACNASSIAMLRFTTNGGADGGGSYMQCDGTGWQQMGGGSVATEELTATSPLQLYDDGGVVNLSISNVARAYLWSGICIACSTDVNFIGPIRNLVGSASRVECSWETAGTGGTTAATIQVYDVTAAASVCTCAIGACNTAARTPMTCNCAGAFVAGSFNALRFSGKGDCAVAPQGTMCTVHVDPP